MLSADKIHDRFEAIRKARYYYEQLLKLCKAQAEAEASRLGKKGAEERGTFLCNPNYFTEDGCRRVRAMQYRDELKAIVRKFNLLDNEIEG